LSALVALGLSLLPYTLADTNSDIRSKFVARAAANNGVIQINSAEYDELTAADRDWSVVVELTALGSELKCAPCKHFHPSFLTIGKAWTKVAKKDRNNHFFASLDFADGQSTFRQLGLNSAPVVHFYPAQTGPLKPAKGKTDMWSYDFNTNLFDAQSFADVISRATPVAVPFYPPPNYGLFFTVGTTAITLLVSARFFWFYFSSFFLSRWTWAFASILSSLIFTSGYMFTRIRAMPFAQNTNAGPQWIASGYQNQFGAETYIVATLYGTLGLSQIALIMLVPRILKPSQQRAAIYIWLAVCIVLYSVLMSLFKIKNAGYPFRLLF